MKGGDVMVYAFCGFGITFGVLCAVDLIINA